MQAIQIPQISNQAIKCNNPTNTTKNEDPNPQKHMKLRKRASIPSMVCQFLRLSLTLLEFMTSRGSKSETHQRKIPEANKYSIGVCMFLFASNLILVVEREGGGKANGIFFLLLLHPFFLHLVFLFQLTFTVEFLFLFYFI